MYTTPGKLSTWDAIPGDEDSQFPEGALANPDYKVVASVELPSCLCCRHLGELRSQLSKVEKRMTNKTVLTKRNASKGSAQITCRHLKIDHGTKTFIFAGPQQYNFYEERRKKASQRHRIKPVSATSSRVEDTAGKSSTRKPNTGNTAMETIDRPILRSKRTSRNLKRKSNVSDAETSGQHGGPRFKG